MYHLPICSYLCPVKKEITFSRVFPEKNREGGATLFVEKILNGLGVKYQSESYFQQLLTLNEQALSRHALTVSDLERFWTSLQSTADVKLHTIRRLHRFQVGDVLTPSVYLGAPNQSPTIIFGEDVEVMFCPNLQLDEALQWHLHHRRLGEQELLTLAKNDGVSLQELSLWFNAPTQAQLVCWSMVRYDA
jgi:hypothetical protein